ncbi:S9 family peptidase [Rheinheimera sp.]|jgi:prolyl oligopeptidase|uniref:S9 family peptidase n=1 Tax=Rheinheimera sp. TaxID=1869214 RepID=UPI002613AF7C|nr:S9 family peptidase [Rheinheimera sp.]MCA1931318.1 S9 family peptidase [Rheinheimera sp.]
MKHSSLYLALLTSTLLLSACDKTPKTETAMPAAATAAETKTAAVPAYTPAQFYATKSYMGNDINHKADALLVASDETGVFNLYKVSLDGKSWTALTHSTTESILPIGWFPKDDRVLYKADQGGNELHHLYVLELDGSVKDLTPGDKHKAEFIGWTDDDKFWVMTNERDPKFFDLYSYDSSSYQRTLVYQNNQGYDIGALSDNGRYIALSKERTNADNNLYLVDLQSADKTPVHITPHQGNVSHGVYGFSRDNNQLIFGSDEKSEFSEAFAYNITEKVVQPYSKADWDIMYIGFSKDNKYKVEAVNADASTKISITDQSTGKALQLPELPAGDLRGVTFSADSQYLSFYVNADNSPSNLFVWKLSEAKAERLTQALDKAIDENVLVTSDVVRYPSFDDLAIPALLYKPKQASSTTKVPALIWIHGGPGGQSRTGYNAAIQHLVNQGYAVLAVNNRGSSGYGKTFYHLDDLKHGEHDLQDIVYGKKYLQSLDWVATDRIGVMGGSYGGYLTMAAMAFTDEFKVGINIFGVTNWVRTLESIPAWWESFRESLYAELGDPAKDGERLRRISPVFHGDKVKKPVLVVQGANDPRVLQVESDEMVAAIRAQNVPVEYVLFPDEGHGFLKKENRIKAQEAYLAFLQKYL